MNCVDIFPRFGFDLPKWVFPQGGTFGNLGPDSMSYLDEVYLKRNNGKVDHKDCIVNNGEVHIRNNTRSFRKNEGGISAIYDCDSVRRTACDVKRALDYLEENNILYVDLNENNVFIETRE